MKTILDLFRESYTFKIILGLITFFASHQMTGNSNSQTKENKKYPTEISFENKFFKSGTFDFYDL